MTHLYMKVRDNLVVNMAHVIKVGRGKDGVFLVLSNGEFEVLTGEEAESFWAFMIKERRL